MTTRTCPVCKDPILGRIDKKYCCDQCRSQANNQKRMESQRILLDTNQILRKNRSILKSLCPPLGKATVRKDVLISMGFNLNNFTALYVTPSRHVYYICYDYGYTPIREDQTEKAVIVNWLQDNNNLNPWNFVKQ